MRLYGSLNNRLMENSKQPTPVVGMGVTQCMYTDRHAYTIVEVISPKKIVVQQDDATRTDNNGLSESQQYSYKPDPDAPKEVITLRKNGRWIKQGNPMDSAGYLLGHREEYRDPNY